MQEHKIKNIITDHIGVVPRGTTEYDCITIIGKCKTGKLGYTINRCEECGEIKIIAKSCRNRNCPNCQNRAREKWIEKQEENVIETKYYHVIATIPDVLQEVFMQNKEELYKMHMRVSAEALIELCRDERYVGGEIGVLAIYHTWTQKMHYHPHVHMLIPEVGIKGEEIKKPRNEKFLVPIKVYSKKYRGKLIVNLKKLYYEGKLKFYNEIEKYGEVEEFEKLLNRLSKKEFVTYIKKPYKNAETVIEYFGRYAYKIAISESRIKEYKEGKVTYKYKDRKEGVEKEETISGEVFTKRFVLHILPKGFRKIRSFGYLSNSTKKKKLELIRKKLKRIKSKEKLEEKKKKSESMYCCSKCGGHYKYIGDTINILKTAEVIRKVKLVT